jgi:nitrate reductase NapE component
VRARPLKGGYKMTRKRIVQLIVFASVVLLAVGLVGGIGCSNDK